MKASLRKRATVLLMALSLAFAVFLGLSTADSVSVAAATGLSGEGTTANPYLIQSADDMNLLRNYVGASYRNKEFHLTRNIDLKQFTQWNPIGTGANAATAFQGNFSGNGFAIYNINIERPNVEYQGLFGSVYYGTIRDIGIASGTIIGGNTTGGIVAYMNNGSVVNSYNKAMVGIQRIWNDPGGIVGTATNYSHIEGCFNAGHINGEVAGGIVGTLSGWSSISNCYNTGVVTGLTNDSWTPNTRLNVGGIVGYLSQSSISHVYNTGRIERYGDKDFDMGALVGNIHDTNHSALGAGLYYDSEESGVPYGVYASTNKDYAKSTVGAKTSAEMLKKSTYTAFDFNNKWYIKDGDHTPMLRGMLNFDDSTIQPRVSYVVTFNGNGGVLAKGQEVQYVYEGDSAVPPVYTMEGYAHNGYSGGDFHNVTSDLTLISSWKKNAYTVKYHYAGGYLDTSSPYSGVEYTDYLAQAVEYGADGLEPSVKRAAYTFAGWDKSSKFITANTDIYAIWVSGGYNYRFEGNGGTLSGIVSGFVSQGGEIPSYPGYNYFNHTFLGWEREFNEATNTLVLTAMWIKNPTVEFNLMDGISAGGGALTQSVAYGGSAILPANPTREGFDFSGWDKSETFIFSDTVITAQWTVKKYTVEFIGNGGTYVSGDVLQTVEHGKSAVAPIYQRSDASFAGWDKDFSKVVAPIVVTAQWNANFYTVTFDGKGGVWDSTSHPMIQQVAHGGTAEAPRLTLDGYVFDGWSTALNNITDNITITAKWAPLVLSVKFQGNNGLTEDSSSSKILTVQYGSDLLPPAFYRTGHVLTGWKVSGDTFVYSASSIGSVTEHLVLDAQWTPNTYSVTFGGNGGKTTDNLSSKVLSVSYGESLTAPIFSKEGHILSGWKVIGGTDVYLPNTIASVTQDLSLEAQWTPFEFIVKFQGNGGTSLDGAADQTVTTEFGSNITPPTFNKDGHILAGWLLTGTSTLYSTSNIGNVTDNLVLTAQWTITEYTVTFNGNGGKTADNLSSKVLNASYGESLTAPAFTKEGNVLTGWKVVGSSTIYTPNSIASVTQDLTLEAQWTSLEFAVKFHGNGGTALDDSIDKTLIVQYGGNVASPAFYKDGHVLTGWLLVGTSTVYPAGSISNVTENMVLSAQWTAAEYTVTFVGNGGATASGSSIVQKKVFYGLSVANDAPKFYRTGYDFAGWNVTSLDNIKQDMTVQAQWKFKTIAPNVQVEDNANGTTTLKATGLPEIEGVNYTYRWEKLTNGVWTSISGATSNSLVLLPGDDYSNYRVIIGVEGTTGGDGTTGADESGYASGSDSFTDTNGNRLENSATGTGSNQNGQGIGDSQKIIIVIAAIVGILLLLLIIIMVARSISRERQRQTQSNGRWY